MTETIVDARILWNPTGIMLEQGVTYQITVQGVWRDASIECGGEGYRMREKISWYKWPAFWAAQWLRPLPTTGERWFQLVGKVGDSVFEIGGGASIQAPYSGELLCAANDARGFYGNNHGSLTVIVTP